MNRRSSVPFPRPFMALLVVAILLCSWANPTHAEPDYFSSSGSAVATNFCSGQCPQDGPCSPPTTPAVLPAADCTFVFMNTLSMPSFSIIDSTYAYNLTFTSMSDAFVTWTGGQVRLASAGIISFVNFNGDLPNVRLSARRVYFYLSKFSFSSGFTLVSQDTMDIEVLYSQFANTTDGSDLFAITAGDSTTASFTAYSSVFRSSSSVLVFTSSNGTLSNVQFQSATVTAKYFLAGTNPALTTSITGGTFFVQALMSYDSGTFGAVSVQGAFVTCISAGNCDALFTSTSSSISAALFNIASCNIQRIAFAKGSGLDPLRTNSLVITGTTWTLGASSLPIVSLAADLFNTTVSITTSNIVGTTENSGLISLQSAGGYLTNLDVDAFSTLTNGASHGCGVYLDGTANLVKTSYLKTLCFGGNSTITGAPLTITNQILGLNISATGIGTLSLPALNMYSIATIKTAIVAPSRLNFLPQDTSSYIKVDSEVSALSPSLVYVDWPNWLTPVLSTVYTVCDRVTPTFNLASTPNYNIAFQSEHDTAPLTYSFLPVTCNPRCPAAHITRADQCPGTLTCPCLAPWGGPYCECNTTGIPAVANCDQAGGARWVSYGYNYSIQPDSTLEIPVGHTFQVDNLLNSGTLVLTDGAVISTGNFCQNGTLNAHFRLIETTTTDGCSVVSTTQIRASQVAFLENSNSIFLANAGGLSTDGSCTPTGSTWYNSIDNATISSTSTATILSSATLAIGIEDPTGKTYFRYKFQRSTNTISSDSWSALTLSTAPTATSFSLSRGTVTLSIGMPPTPPTASCPSPPPSTAFTCVNGVWVANSSVIVAPGTQISITSPTTVQGDLGVSAGGTLTFTLPSVGSGAVLNINGCVSINGSIVVQLTEEDLKTIEKSSGRSRESTLVSAQCASSGSYSNLQVSAPNNCRKVSARRVDGGSDSDLAVIFKVDRSSCDRWWIILVSVLGGIILLVAIIALLAAFTPLKGIIRPFSKRSEKPEQIS